MVNISLTQPRTEVLRRMDLARRALRKGHAPAAVAEVTGLSPYVVELLSLPEEDLKGMVEKEGRAEHETSLANSRLQKERRRREAESARR